MKTAVLTLIATVSMSQTLVAQEFTCGSVLVSLNKNRMTSEQVKYAMQILVLPQMKAKPRPVLSGSAYIMADVPTASELQKKNLIILSTVPGVRVECPIMHHY